MVAAVVAFASFMVAAVSSAATFSVTSTDSTGPGTLWQAVLDAEANAGADVIDFSVVGLIEVVNTPFPLSSEAVEIRGPGADRLRVQLPGTGGFALGFGASGPQTFRISDLALTGPSSVNLAAGHEATIVDCVFRDSSGRPIVNSGEMTLQRTIIKDNVGGLTNDGQISVLDSVLESNLLAAGAGAALQTTGSVIIRRTHFLRNQTSNGSGGAIWAQLSSPGSLLIADSFFESNGATDGGAVALNRSPGSSTAVLRLERSTFAGNLAFGGVGGAVLFGVAATVESVNNTFVGNIAIGAGGALAADVGADRQPYLLNTTVSANQAGQAGGVSLPGGVAMAVNNIVANNVGGDCGQDLQVAGGHNLSSDTSCGFDGPGDQEGVDPGLTSLAYNGGFAPSLIPPPGSPVIDAGDDTPCRNGLLVPLSVPAPWTDQNLSPRSLDGDSDGQPVCDVGASELGMPMALNFRVANLSDSPISTALNEARIEVGFTDRGVGRITSRFAATTTAAIPAQAGASNETDFMADYQIQLAVLAADGEPWSLAVQTALRADLTRVGAGLGGTDTAELGPISYSGTPLTGSLDHGLGSLSGFGIGFIAIDEDRSAVLSGVGTGALQPVQIRFGIPLFAGVVGHPSIAFPESTSVQLGLAGSLENYVTENYPSISGGRRVDEAGHFVTVSFPHPATAAIFNDGFESGDVTAWSSSVP